MFESTTEAAVDSSQEVPVTPPGPYRRILLKLSGEALNGPQGFGIDTNRAEATVSAPLV